jgi:hypothetical protein
MNSAATEAAPLKWTSRADELSPVVNYGWEINVVNLLRLTTAYEDLDTATLVREVMN